MGSRKAPEGGQYRVLNTNRLLFLKSAMMETFPHGARIDLFHTLQKNDITDEGPTIADIGVTKSDLNYGLPYPFCPPHLTAVVDDPCLRLLKDKNKYLKQVARCRQIYKLDRKWLTADYIKKNEVFSLPKYFLQLCTGVIKDENPYFKSDYDYHYTGGLLARTTVGSHTVLIRPTSLNKICFTNADDPRANLNMDFNENCVYSINAQKNVFLVRQKLNVLAYKFKIYDDFATLKKKLLFTLPSPDDVPYADFKSLPGVEFACADVKYNFALYDVHTFQRKFEHAFGDDDCGLCQFEYFDDNTVMFLNNYDLHFLDVRSKTARRSTFKSDFFTCDTVVSVCRSELNEQHVYILTKHTLIKYDVRKERALRKWSHMLASPPIACRATRDGDEEIVTVASFTEIVCLQVREGENYFVHGVPSMGETFYRCKLTKRFVLNEELESRMNLCVAGIEQMHKKNGNYTLYTCNSIGDVFCQSIGRKQPNTDATLEKFSSWVDLLDPQPKPLIVTDIQEMSCYKDMLLKPVNEENLEYLTRENPGKAELLASCPDMSKYSMFSIWNDDATDEKATHGRVAEWVQANNGNVSAEDMES